MGRYWAMDRDLRWDRTESLHVSYTWQGNLVKTPEEVMDASYGSGKTDSLLNHL